MDKVKLPGKYKVYIPLVVLFVVLLVFLPRNPTFNYDYKIGSPWMYETLVAKFPFPLMKTDEQFFREKENAAAKVYPYFRLNTETGRKNLATLEKGRARFSSHPQLYERVRTQLVSIYERGIYDGKSLQGVNNIGKLAHVMRDRSMVEVPFSDFYSVESARESLYNIIKSADAADAVSLNGVNRDVLDSGISSLIEPNLFYDEEKTRIAYQAALDYISPTEGVIEAGKTIVTKGSLITADICQMLDSYRAEYESNLSYKGNQGFQWFGNALLALLLILILFLSISYTNPFIFDQYNKYLYLLMIYTLSFAASVIIVKYNPKYVFMIPFPLIAMYLLAFFKKRVVWTVYINSLLPLLIFSHNGIQLFVMYLIAGAATIYSYAYFNRGWLQFVTAFIVFVSLVITWMMFIFVNGIDQYIDWYIMLYLFLGSLFSVAGYPLIYLFEKMFSLVSNTKLVELADTNNTLLRELAEKAPGTFQHCLQVMNLADAVAREIDANVALIRAGALYHDIGKINNPQCFIENETAGVRYHENLSPAESAKDIISHVPDGMAIADKYNLPNEVKDFIITHHGTTCAAYFYNKYLIDGGSADYKYLFTYDGRKPETKEQVILMMCDTLEAASRSLKDYSEKSINDLVENLFKSKISDGQLENADITLHELNIMKSKIKEYLRRTYHVRVAYPKKPALARE